MSVCLSVCVSPIRTYTNSVMSWFVHLHADVSVLLCLTVSLYVCLSVCLCVCVSPTHTYRNSVMSWFVHLHADVSFFLCLTVSLYVCLCVCVSPTETLS